MQLGFGTAAIGRPQYINIRIDQSNTEFDLDTFRKEGIRVLESAYQAGIRYFDTAPGYGMAEQIIHDWLNENNHSDIELATKWGYKYTANFDPNAKVHEIKEHSLALLNEQWKNSETLLPGIGTLQIHSATFESGVLKNEAVLHRLAELKESKGIRIGMTSTGDNQTEVLKYALDIHLNGNQLFDVFQVTYNVLDQSLASMINDFKGKRIVIKEALANGRNFRNEAYPNYMRLYESMENLAAKYQVGTDAIAIRFCLDSIRPFIVLSGASQPAQVFENLKADDFRLTEAELDLLRSFAVEANEYWSERKRLAWN